MKIELKNIGIFKEASVDVCGITVIAGENASGKSTVGKALYSVFHALSSYDKKINEKRISNLLNLLGKLPIKNIFYLRDMPIELFDEFFQSILTDSEKYINDVDLLKEKLIEFFEIRDDDSIALDIVDEITPNMVESLKLTDEEILRSLVNASFNMEFNSEINNRFNNEPGSVDLYINDKKIGVSIVDDNITSIENPIKLIKDIVYIDDPYVLDDLNIRRSGYSKSPLNNNHRDDLIYKLEKTNEDTLEGIKVNNKLSEVFEKLDGIKLGNLITTGKVYKYNDPVKKIDLDIRNIATGLKTFVIIKTLLDNGTLVDKGTIILDEPEIHLHPKWQIVLAELIVLLQKTFNMHILLNTHSPYFLRAIDVFSEKHGIKDKTKYYLASKTNTSSTIEDVTDDIEKIYKLLADAFDDIDQVIEDED
uniref:AAA family ATPase n=1 Tax=Ezakiella massiliensis TaxID=1852374 RepID=UPI00094E44D0|nr:AAA family ATPase [Ezakiella massiliensis]